MKVNKIIRATKEEELNITGATLLSVEEAKALPQRLREYSNWWWLRSPGRCSNLAAYVNYDGLVHARGSNVDYTRGAVRPALLISNLESSNLQIGDKFIFGSAEFEIVSKSMAFCLGDIGEHPFRNDWQADDANVYEVSDVKKFVDKWFEDAKESAK